MEETQEKQPPEPRDNYEEIANSPEEWTTFAKIHHFAANTLRDARKSNQDNDTAFAHLETIPIENMLRGFALECLFKATWLKRGEKIVENGAFKNIPNLGDHQLDQFASKLNLKCNMKMLKRWTEIIRWWGRYPIPKKPSPATINEVVNTDQQDEDDYKSLVISLSQKLGENWAKVFLK